MMLNLINFNNRMSVSLHPVRFQPSFGLNAQAQGRDVFEFSKKTDKPDKPYDDFLSSPKNLMLKRILDSVADKDCFLGCGNSAVVYKIKETPYCIRFPKGQKSLEVTRMTTNLSEKDKINHVVARFPRGISLMKTIEGFPLAVSESNKKIKQKELNNIVENLPVSAFHGLFKQVCHAKDNNMMFDCSAMNVIVNPEKKTLTAIDFYEMDPKYPEDVKVLSYMFEALQSCENAKKIAGKIVLGAMEELKPGKVPCLNIDDFKFVKFVSSLQYKCSQPPEGLDEIADALVELECMKLQELIGDDSLELKKDLASKLEETKSLIVKNLIN